MQTTRSHNKAKPGHSAFNLTYDRVFLLSRTLPTETDIMLFVLNGNGIDNDKYMTAF